MVTLLNGWCASRNPKANTVAVQRFRFVEKDNTGPTHSSVILLFLTSALENQQVVACKLSSRTKNSLAKITAVFTEGRKEGNEQNVLPEM